jgi:hypothetical protein
LCIGDVPLHWESHFALVLLLGFFGLNTIVVVFMLVLLYFLWSVWYPPLPCAGQSLEHYIIDRHQGEFFFHSLVLIFFFVPFDIYIFYLKFIFNFFVGFSLHFPTHKISYTFYYKTIGCKHDIMSHTHPLG